MDYDVEALIEDIGKNIILCRKIFDFIDHPRDADVSNSEIERRLDFMRQPIQDGLSNSWMPSQLMQFMENWNVLHEWRINFYPLRPSGRRDGLCWDGEWLHSTRELAGPSWERGEPFNPKTEAEKNHRLLGWFDLYSNFRGDDVPSIIFDACLGAWPTEVSANAVVDHPLIDSGNMGVKVGDLVYEMPAPQKDPDASFYESGGGPWFARYLIEQICDPAFAGANEFFKRPERYPALKRVLDASRGYERAYFIDRLISERFAEALLREAENGFPLRIGVVPYSLTKKGDWGDQPYLDEEGDMPWLDEIAPTNLSWRLFNGADGSPGWIQRYTAFPAIKDQMRGLAPIGDAQEV